MLFGVASAAPVTGHRSTVEQQPTANNNNNNNSNTAMFASSSMCHVLLQPAECVYEPFFVR